MKNPQIQFFSTMSKTIIFKTLVALLIALSSIESRVIDDDLSSENRQTRRCPTCPADAPELLTSPWYGSPRKEKSLKRREREIYSNAKRYYPDVFLRSYLPSDMPLSRKGRDTSKEPFANSEPSGFSDFFEPNNQFAIKHRRSPDPQGYHSNTYGNYENQQQSQSHSSDIHGSTVHRIINENPQTIIRDNYQTTVHESHKPIHEQSHRPIYKNPQTIIHENPHRTTNKNSQTIIHENPHRPIYKNPQTIIHENPHRPINKNSQSIIHENPHRPINKNSQTIIHENPRRIYENSHRIVHEKPVQTIIHQNVPKPIQPKPVAINENHKKILLENLDKIVTEHVRKKEKLPQVPCPNCKQTLCENRSLCGTSVPAKTSKPIEIPTRRYLVYRGPAENWHPEELRSHHKPAISELIMKNRQVEDGTGSVIKAIADHFIKSDSSKGKCACNGPKLPKPATYGSEEAFPAKPKPSVDDWDDLLCQQTSFVAPIEEMGNTYLNRLHGERINGRNSIRRIYDHRTTYQLPISRDNSLMFESGLQATRHYRDARKSDDDIDDSKMSEMKQEPESAEESMDAEIGKFEDDSETEKFEESVRISRSDKYEEPEILEESEESKRILSSEKIEKLGNLEKSDESDDSEGSKESEESDEKLAMIEETKGSENLGEFSSFERSDEFDVEARAKALAVIIDMIKNMENAHKMDEMHKDIELDMEKPFTVTESPMLRFSFDDEDEATTPSPSD